MLEGVVKFRARIVDPDRGVTFPLFEFNPNNPNVAKVEIEGPNGNEILTSVHLAAVANRGDGTDIATKVHMAAIDRISFFQGIVIDNGEITDRQFSEINLTPGHTRMFVEPICYFVTLGEVRFVHGLTEASLKPKLEQIAPPGERSFSLFRSALLSTSPVERFMHLYNILLMFFDDHQPKVDEFIIRERPQVVLTPDPRKRKKIQFETVYARLRNELAHKRVNVNVVNTKTEMKNHLGELIALTKRAIELHS